jgi:uncharacterized membrane protein SpoIIM required for sporulation
MVLERLVSVREAVKSPWLMFLIGGILSVISLFISFLIFPNSIGLFAVFLITFAMTPFMVNLITYEEVTTEDELRRRVNLNFFQKHWDVLLIYIAFFSGMVVFLSVTFLLLPDKTVQPLFEDQINEIKLIRGDFAGLGTFQTIIINNLGVLVISFLFAFLYGSGAIFILSWNASVLAAAIGIGAKSIGGLMALPLSVATFLPHGSLEIMAYFIVGVAGGLVSVGLTRRKSIWFKVVLKDSAKLVILAVVILFIAAAIETMLL